MKFKNKVTLFVSKEESESDKFRNYIKENRFIFDDINNITQIDLIGRYLTLTDILELENVLNSRITVCSKYIGSTKTIRDLGLD